jgi:Tfp pilus assembly protein PilX
MKKLKLTPLQQEGFIPMMICLVLILVTALVLIYMRVAKHQ